MDIKLKYDLERLEWQQFEILSFKCLQFDVSKSLYFIEGGSDKGRDFTFNGRTDFWGDGAEKYKYLFQAKHKSKQNSFNSLNKDLKTELEKVFIINKLDYNYYCLVTNIPLSGSECDTLEETFHSFISDNNLSVGIQFKIYSYRHIEACLDNNDSLKWVFPSVVRNTDFKFLIESIIQKEELNISSGWLSIFEKNKSNFVYTNIFEEALVKLRQNNILLLSGPSKSGKTYNAEMLLLNYFCEKSFIPYKIDKIEEFDRFYDSKKSQIFLFDDAFGKYNIDLSRADSFNRKLEYIFEAIDDKHKCIFTSREYIYKAFLNYSEDDVKTFITKITVEVDNLTIGEKESVFLRYYKLLSDKINFKEKDLISILNHKNFSPETIRAYFVNNNTFGLDAFVKHLNSPDDYLEKDFINLSEEKKIVLISTLLSLKGTVSSISYSYDKICFDLNKTLLISINDVLYQLEGSMLKSRDDEYTFYHPSMFEFFVRYISKDTSIYKKLLLSNINTRLLDVVKFDPKIQFSNDIRDSIKIGENDLNLLIKGFKRAFDNPELSISELNSIIGWIHNPDVQLSLKILLKKRYIELKSGIASLLLHFDYSRIVHENTYLLGDFFKIIHYEYYNEVKIKSEFLKEIIKSHKGNNDYWYLVFKMMPLLDDDFIFEVITGDWLNNFFIELRNEINSLGKELYGEAYPEFKELEEYNKFKKEKRKEGKSSEMKNRATFKQSTNRNWYPRYTKVKEKMNSLKTCPPHGHKIYNRLLSNYSHLKALEDNQLNRYLFNKEKKWW